MPGAGAFPLANSNLARSRTEGQKCPREKVSAMGRLSRPTIGHPAALDLGLQSPENRLDPDMTCPSGEEQRVFPPLWRLSAHQLKGCGLFASAYILCGFESRHCRQKR